MRYAGEISSVGAGLLFDYVESVDTHGWR